jgi:PAS domain-containing protein
LIRYASASPCTTATIVSLTTIVIFRPFGLLDNLVGAEFCDLLICKLDAREIAGPHVVDDPEGWIKRRLAHRRNPDIGPLEERLTDGLREAVENGTDALAFWDQNDRLVLRNSAFVNLFSLIDQDVIPGVQCKTILDNAGRHLFDAGGAAPESWSEERYRLHLLPQHRETLRHRDGRWFLIDEHRSHDGGVVTRISDVTAIEDLSLIVSVSDDGVGISPQDQERVFRPFEQGENNLDRTHEGTGLGLALCKSLVELHGGHITLDSQEDLGTTITFYIPQDTIETETTHLANTG